MNEIIINEYDFFNFLLLENKKIHALLKKDNNLKNFNKKKNVKCIKKQIDLIKNKEKKNKANKKNFQNTINELVAAKKKLRQSKGEKNGNS